MKFDFKLKLYSSFCDLQVVEDEFHFFVLSFVLSFKKFSFQINSAKNKTLIHSGNMKVRFCAGCLWMMFVPWLNLFKKWSVRRELQRMLFPIRQIVLFVRVPYFNRWCYVLLLSCSHYRGCNCGNVIDNCIDQCLISSWGLVGSNHGDWQINQLIHQSKKWNFCVDLLRRVPFFSDLASNLKGQLAKKIQIATQLGIFYLFIFFWQRGQSLINQSAVSNFTPKTTNNNKRLFAAYFCFNQSTTLVFPAFVCLSYFRDFLFWRANIKWEEFSSVSVGLPGVQCGATATKINVNTETESRADCYQ